MSDSSRRLLTSLLHTELIQLQRTFEQASIRSHVSLAFRLLSLIAAVLPSESAELMLYAVPTESTRLLYLKSTNSPPGPFLSFKPLSVRIPRFSSLVATTASSWRVSRPSTGTVIWYWRMSRKCGQKSQGYQVVKREDRSIKTGLLARCVLFS